MISALPNQDGPRTLPWGLDSGPNLLLTAPKTSHLQSPISMPPNMLHTDSKAVAQVVNQLYLSRDYRCQKCCDIHFEMHR
ncbi:hypothetical protein KC19_7G030000 [Ceratodon purpureus]|uniref:Uncharacterized protein n=1 Tax=Ceratodon purpureus TaxID=3225 RepID=A0A8T0H283_CERPU|nr:hypothetical protein KC19_7G030000 [Ceratodon purpureus]